MSKKNINFVVGIVLGAIFLILWVKMINWEEFTAYFKDPKIWQIIPYSIFYILAYYFRSLRWRELLKPVHRLNQLECFGIFSSGMLINYLIPVRAGELAKSFILKLKKKISVAVTLPTIFLDKLTDLFPILLVIIAIPLISMKLTTALSTIIGLILFLFIALLLFCYVAIFHREFAYRVTKYLFRIFPARLRLKLEDFLEKFLTGISLVRRRDVNLWLVFALTFLAVISESIYIYLVFRLFGSSLSFLQVMLGYTLMNLTYILPTPPAQIGSNQFMWVLIFSVGLGADKNLTSAAVTMSHFLTSIIIFLMGSLSMFSLNVKYSEIISVKEG